MNNFIRTKLAFAFTFSGCTFEGANDMSWVSIKTCIDPAVNFQIQKLGRIEDIEVLNLLACNIKKIINSRVV